MNQKNGNKRTGGVHYVLPPKATASTTHGGYRKTLTCACCPSSVTLARGITYGDVERDWVEINGVRMSLEFGRQHILPMLGINPATISSKVLVPDGGRGTRRNQTTSTGRIVHSVRTFGGHRRLKAGRKRRAS